MGIQTRDTDFPALIASIRRERKCTQEQLAREMDVTFASVNNWENARNRPHPNHARRLKKMAGELGLSTIDGAPVDGNNSAVAGLADRAPLAFDVSPAGLSGWPLSPDERRDFFHRPRPFPPGVLSWRTRMVKHVMNNPQLFTRVPWGAEPPQVRAMIDAGITWMREIARVLAVLHGTPRLGNRDDPVDELVYIIMSRKTPEKAYQSAFIALKNAFPRWDMLLDSPRDKVEDLVYSGGLAGKKTDTLYLALGALRDRFGTCTLEPAREWPGEKLAEFLCSLPEIQKKSAYCVMMYSMGREVFPVDAHVGRCLKRLGPYRELGLDMSKMDHKKLQVVLDDLVPPNLRYSLHVNLVTHGRTTCRAIRPRCQDCDLSRFCNHHRRSVTVSLEKSDVPTVVDLFCGAGGLSSGFRRAGFRPILAVDSDPVALKTYRLNHPEIPEDRVICRDIEGIGEEEWMELTGGRRPDVLLGAPPCQGFSTVGNRSKLAKNRKRIIADQRNYLFKTLGMAATALNPRVVVMENVTGMKSARQQGGSFMEAALSMFDELGFGTFKEPWSLRAEMYGVAQFRERCFLLAWTGPVPPTVPEAKYRSIDGKSEHLDALPPVTLDAIIGDLPPLAANTGEAVASMPDSMLRKGTDSCLLLGKFGLSGRGRVLYNHTARYNNDNDLKRYGMLRPGEDSAQARERLGLRWDSEYRPDVFDDKYARLRRDLPCKTIVAHLAKDGNGFIHPTQVRSLTQREAARIQTFDDEFVFTGSPSDQWKQIGNAVPPVLGEAIARSVLAVLASGKVRR